LDAEQHWQNASGHRLKVAPTQKHPVSNMSSSSASLRPTPLKARVGYAEDMTTMPIVNGIDGIVRSALVRRLQTVDEVRQAFTSGDLDVALLPTTDVVRMREVSIIPCSSVATMGASRLITLFSKSIPTEINRVLVDAEDLGGTPLAQLMINRKLSIRPEFHRSPVPLDPSSYNLQQNDGYDAYLLTGKNCFMVRRDQFAFIMDLTLAWYEFTRLPYVVHVWAMRKSARIGALDKELGDVMRRNEGSNEAASRTSERLGVSESGIRAVYDKALVTTFDQVITQSIRRYGQELAQNRIVPTMPVALYVPPAVRKV
jgi:predicted solute-binding protein